MSELMLNKSNRITMRLSKVLHIGRSLRRAT